MFLLFYWIFRRNMIVFYSRCCLEGFLFHALWKYGEQWDSFSRRVWVCVLVCVCGINVAERCEEWGLCRWLIAHEVCGSHKHTHAGTVFIVPGWNEHKVDWPHCAGLQCFSEPVMWFIWRICWIIIIVGSRLFPSWWLYCDWLNSSRLHMSVY